MTIKSWLGQSTTGTGIAAILASLGAVASGALTWQQALPLAIGGLAGVIWPENTGLNTQASAIASSIENLMSSGPNVPPLHSTTAIPAADVPTDLSSPVASAMNTAS